jgi:hypothetical protein
MGVLYKLTSPSNKSYIGISSKSLDARWAKHVEHALGKRTAGALYAALRKHRPETFKREVLAEEADWDTLRAMEIDAIRSHSTLAPNGYNITQGGEGTRTRLSAQAKANISAAQKKRYQRPGEKERLFQAGAAARERRHQKAVADREARRQARRAYVVSAEFKALHSEATKRGMATPEMKASMTAFARARAADPEWRAKISASRKGQKLAPCSEEHKRRIAEARRREWADPVMRAKRLAAFAAAKAAKETAA